MLDVDKLVVKRVVLIGQAGPVEQAHGCMGKRRGWVGERVGMLAERDSGRCWEEQACGAAWQALKRRRTTHDPHPHLATTGSGPSTTHPPTP